MENGDSLSGKIKGITDGKIIMATAYSDATVPLDQVTEINLASAGAAPAKQRSGDFRASLAGGGSVTFKLESWDANHTVVVTSPDFGKASFSAGIYRSLQFKTDKQQPPMKRTPVIRTAKKTGFRRSMKKTKVILLSCTLVLVSARRARKP